MAQDDYYYEIQLTNKQLVFYFMAGATGLILSFLAGVMVGRGVDTVGGEVQAAKPVREERIVPEEPKPAAPPSAEELTYAKSLESEKPEDGIEKGKPAVAEPALKPPNPRNKEKDGAKKPGKDKPAPVASAPPAAEAAPAPSTAPGKPEPAKPEPAKPAPAKPEPAASSPKPGHPSSAPFTIQVGAFKDKATAEQVIARLKAKGYTGYVVSPEGAEGGLYNVRVGPYPARADAERIERKLRDEEKFKPFVVR